MSSGTESDRTGLSSPAFSFVANRGVGVVAVVSVLLFATVGLRAALIGTVAFALYYYVVYDLAYHVASKRLQFRPVTDFVLRTVVLLGGALALPKLMVRQGVDSGLLLDYLAAIEVPLGLLLIVGGGLLALEGLGMARTRLTVARATPFVGQEVDDGPVSVQGTARPTEREVRTDGGRVAESDDEDEPRIMTDGGRPVDDAGALRPVTDGGRVVETDDPFAGTEFEPIERFEDDGESTATGTTSVDAADEDDRSGDDGTDPLPVDPAEVDGVPVAVDGDTGTVVATRSDCTVNGWRKAVVRWLVERFEADHGVSLRNDREALSRMASVADRVRDDFTERAETEVLLPFIADVGDRTVHIRRRLVAVDPDGTPRTEPPFGGYVDDSEDSTDATDAEAVEATADAGSAADAGTADAAGTTGTTTETPETPDSTVDPDGPGVEATTETETTAEAADATTRTDEPTVDDTDATAAETTQTAPVTIDSPFSDRDRVACRFRCRGKVRRPIALRKLPVESEDLPVVDRVPDAVPVADALPGVASRLPGVDRLPDRIETPSAPDVFEDDPEEPGVRWLAGADTATVPFEVDSFGDVTVDPDDVELVMSADAAGTDAPGLWYETGVRPGDRITVVGRLSEGGDGDGRRNGAIREGTAVVGHGETADLKQRLTRGALGRLGVGLGAVAVGSTIAVPGLAATTTAPLVLGGVAAGYAATNRETVVDRGRETAARAAEFVEERVQSARDDDGGLVDRARDVPWLAVGRAVDAVR